MQTLLTVIILLAILCFVFGYNGWLKENYGVSAASLGRILVGIVDTFLWLRLGNAETVWDVLGIVVVAGSIFLLLLAVNYTKIKTLPQAIIMTLWHLTAGLAIIVIWNELTQNKKKRK